LLVMDYVDGESVAALATAAARRREPIPCAILSAILADALRGLHAAHTAGEAQGKPRQIVHRDVSPENILVGVDGIARVLDFGVAHATNRAQSTRTGQIKGKLRYLSPEQVHGDATPRSDVFAAGIVAWELLVGERLFGGDSHGATLAEILSAKIARPSRRRPDIPPALDDAVMKSLARNPADRFASALEMAQAVVAAVRPATPIEVAEWVTTLGGAALAARQERARQIERVAAPAPARRRPANPSAAEPSVTAPARPSAAAAWTRRVVVPLALAAVVALSVAMMRATAPDATRPSIDPPAEAGAAPTVADPPAATTERAKTGDPVAPRHEHLVSPARHTASPAADRCKPPYAFDDAGHKHYFPECL